MDIHNNVEVRLTGRKAIRKRKRSRQGNADDLVIYEVKPLDDKIEWTEWVDKDDLFEVGGEDV